MFQISILIVQIVKFWKQLMVHKSNWKDVEFECMNVGQGLRKLSDFGSEIAMNDTSYQISVTKP